MKSPTKQDAALLVSLLTWEGVFILLWGIGVVMLLGITSSLGLIGAAFAFPIAIHAMLSYLHARAQDSWAPYLGILTPIFVGLAAMIWCLSSPSSATFNGDEHIQITPAKYVTAVLILVTVFSAVGLFMGRLAQRHRSIRLKKRSGS